jgi:WD40 repeat protein
MESHPKWLGRRVALLLAFLACPLLAEGVQAQSKSKVEIVSQIPHSMEVNTVAFSPEGSRVVSGSGDGTLKLWEAQSGRLIRTLEVHAAVAAVAFSLDGVRVLSGNWDNTVKLWDAATGELVRSFVGHSAYVHSVAFSPDGRHVVSGSSDKTLKLWEVASGQLVHTFEGHSDLVFSVAFAPDSARVVSGSRDKTVKLWDVATGQLLRTLNGSGEVQSVAFSPDGARVLSGSSDETIKLWDAGTGQLVRTFAGHSKQVNSVGFAPDGARVVSGSQDETVKLWDTATGQLVRTLGAPDLDSDRLRINFVNSVVVSPDGSRVLSGSRDGTSKLWDAATGQLVRTFEGRSGNVSSIALSPDGIQMVAGGGDKTLNLWDTVTGELVRTLKGHSDDVYSVAFSRDGTRVLSGGRDRTLKLWDAPTGQLVRSIEAYDYAVMSVAFSPAGTRVLSSGLSMLGTPTLWDAVTGEPVRTFEKHSDTVISPATVISVAFSPDGSRVLMGRDDGAVDLWDIATDQFVRTFEGHSRDVYSVAFSPDGTHVLSGGRDKTLKLWDAATGELVRTFEGHRGSVFAVAFSPDGSCVLSGSADETIKLWDAATGQLVRTFEGHTSSVNSIAYSHDGRRIISGSADTTIRLWDIASGQHLATLIGSPDGEWLAMTSEGFFAASPNGDKALSIVRGLEVFSIDQFYQTLYRPDLVREKLTGDANGKVKEAAAKLDLTKLMDSGPVPKVLIKSHSLQDRSSTDLVTIEASLTDQGGGVGRGEWRINGINIGVVAPGTVGNLKKAIALDPGENTIELVVYNGQNLVASVPARANITWTGTEPSAPPRLHVLALGINNYWDGKLKLTYAVPDAKSLSAALKQSGKGLFEDVIVTEVFDGDATAQHLDQVFAELSQEIRPRDVFVFYVAGHGITQDGRYYFIPQDFKYQTDRSFAELGIGQDHLQNWLASIPAKKSILIFDTCESGTLTNVQIASARGGFEQLAAVGRLIQATGRTTLTASLENQPALEGYRGHGVFTFALLDALARADRNGDGLISVTELIEHVDGVVPEITYKTWKTRQVPRSLFQGTNFALGKQLPMIAPAPGEDMIISSKPTHVNTELVRIFKQTGGKGQTVMELQPFTTVTLVKSEKGWVLVAKDGKTLGYVAEANLRKLN